MSRRDSGPVPTEAEAAIRCISPGPPRRGGSWDLRPPLRPEIGTPLSIQIRRQRYRYQENDIFPHGSIKRSDLYSFDVADRAKWADDMVLDCAQAARMARQFNMARRRSNRPPQHRWYPVAGCEKLTKYIQKHDHWAHKHAAGVSSPME